MAISVWEELLENFTKSLERSIELLKDINIENIPGARDQLIMKFQQLKNFLPQNNGEMLIKIIDNSIQESFFPKTNSLAQSFTQILDSRTKEQDYIIQELINGFISSQGQAIASNKEVPILDHLVEAFKKRRDFKIIDYQFYAMFGNPNKPRKYILDRLDKIIKFLGLESEQVTIKKDVSNSEEKIYTFYSFPEDIIEILEGRYIETLENGEKHITKKFDKMVFTSYFLAKLAFNRKNLDNYSINGISAIFSLLLIISFMPKIQIDEINPINRDSHFNSQTMSIIPKSWMTKEILSELLPLLIQIVAFRIGGIEWMEKIALTENKIKMHLQAQFLIKDVNKWILGNMCRVEIPIFIEISNILSEVMIIGNERDV